MHRRMAPSDSLLRAAAEVGAAVGGRTLTLTSASTTVTSLFRCERRTGDGGMSLPAPAVDLRFRGLSVSPDGPASPGSGPPTLFTGERVSGPFPRSSRARSLRRQCSNSSTPLISVPGLDGGGGIAGCSRAHSAMPRGASRGGGGTNASVRGWAASVNSSWSVAALGRTAYARCSPEEIDAWSSRTRSSGTGRAGVFKAATSRRDEAVGARMCESASTGVARISAWYSYTVTRLGVIGARGAYDRLAGRVEGGGRRPSSNFPCRTSLLLTTR